MLIHLLSLIVVVAYGYSLWLYVLSSVSALDRCKRARFSTAIGASFHFLLFFSLLLHVKSDSAVISLHALHLSAVALSIALVFLLIEKDGRATALGVLVMPLVSALFTYSSFLKHGSRVVQELPDYSLMLVLHLGLTAASLVFLCFASIFSVGVLVKEKSLRAQRFSVFFKRLPSLKVLDNWSDRFVTSGFALMVLGLAGGFAMLEGREVSESFSDPRVILSLVSLVLYFMLVSARRVLGYRGRRAAMLTVAGFTSIVCAFIVINHFSYSFHIY